MFRKFRKLSTWDQLIMVLIVFSVLGSSFNIALKSTPFNITIMHETYCGLLVYFFLRIKSQYTKDAVFFLKNNGVDVYRANRIKIMIMLVVIFYFTNGLYWEYMLDLGKFRLINMGGLAMMPFMVLFVISLFNPNYYGYILCLLGFIPILISFQLVTISIVCIIMILIIAISVYIYELKKGNLV